MCEMQDKSAGITEQGVGKQWPYKCGQTHAEAGVLAVCMQVTV